MFVAPCLLVGLLCALYCVLCAGEEPDSDEESGDGDGDDDDSSGENRVSTCLLQKGPQRGGHTTEGRQHGWAAS